MSQGMRRGERSMLWTGGIEARQIASALSADGNLQSEVNEMLEIAYTRAKQAISCNRRAFDRICKLLVQNEVIDGDQVDSIVVRWRGGSRMKPLTQNQAYRPRRKIKPFQ
jgi:hypothetical protein